MTVAEFLQRVSSREITEWQAYAILQNEEWENEKSGAEVQTKVKSNRRRR